MRIPKQYGQSKIESCPFCGKRALTENEQGVPVCLDHKKSQLNDMRCSCGEWLDLKRGKYGVFFSCIKCGAVNFKRALEMNSGSKIKEKQDKTEPMKSPKEITITSDEVDLY